MLVVVQKRNDSKAEGFGWAVVETKICAARPSEIYGKDSEG